MLQGLHLVDPTPAGAGDVVTRRRGLAENHAPALIAAPLEKPVTDRQAAPQLAFHIAGTVDELLALGPEWDSLFETAGRPEQVFQTHAFCALWAQFYATSRDVLHIAVITARHDGRLVMVWPLVVERSLGCNVLAWLGEPVAQYGDVVIAQGMDHMATLTSAWEHVKAKVSPDLLRLRKVRGDAVIAPFLSRLGALETVCCEAPCIVLRGGAGASSFEDRQSGKAKKNRRRLLRRLEETGHITQVTRPASAEAGSLVAAGMDMKRDWLHERALSSRAFKDTRLDQFLAAAASTPGTRTGCRTFAMLLDSRPVAVALGFACKGRMTMHMIAYARAHEKSGVGVLNLEAALRACENEGFEAVDLLAPKADYKMDWTDMTVPVIDYVAGVSMSGHIAARLVDATLRPAAKRAFERLPAHVRRRLLGQPSAG